MSVMPVDQTLAFVRMALVGLHLMVVTMDYQHLITIEPGERSGKPCIRSMRITVSDVLQYLAAGISVEEILADFPELTADDIGACLAFAADRERKLMTVPPA
jgi:uncharacterized protein (DUF433 family)